MNASSHNLVLFPRKRIVCFAITNFISLFLLWSNRMHNVTYGSLTYLVFDNTCSTFKLCLIKHLPICPSISLLPLHQEDSNDRNVTLWNLLYDIIGKKSIPRIMEKVWFRPHCLSCRCVMGIHFTITKGVSKCWYIISIPTNDKI